MRLAVILSCLLSAPALANDGFGGLSASGVTFGQTDAVAMEEERLFIGLDLIAVDYVFRNLTDQDVTGEVIFPLPPIPVGHVLESRWNLPDDPDRPNLVNFTAMVAGQPVAVSIDRIAVIQPPPTEAWLPTATPYDTPGRDVTADLARLGLPLSLDGDSVLASLAALSEAQKAEATALGLAEFYDDGQFADGWPKWAIQIRYHWTQTFPAGQRLTVSHTYDNSAYDNRAYDNRAYDNRAPGGLFSWSHPPEAYMQPVADMYCIDEGTS